jgi:hypothetical protein
MKKPRRASEIDLRVLSGSVSLMIHVLITLLVHVITLIINKTQGICCFVLGEMHVSVLLGMKMLRL